MKKTAALFMSCLLFFPGCSTTQGPGAGTDIRTIGADEIAVGEKIHAQILSNYHVYTEPTVVAYVNGVVGKLAPHAKRAFLPYRCTLLYSEKIYATSAPGGFLYVTTGMLNFLRNEAELAAVLGHEIGELQFQDPRLSRSRKFFDRVTEGVVMVGPIFGQFGALAVLGAMIAHSVADSMKISKEDQLLKADEFGLGYVVAAGYDPQGYLDFIEHFLTADRNMIPYFYDYYEVRPVTEERFKNIQDVFSKLPLEDKRYEVRRDDYLEMTQGIREIFQTA